MKTAAMTLLALSLTQAAALAAGKADLVRKGPAAPPTIDASENTPINYTGGVPATFTGALDLDDSTFNRPVTCGSLSGVGTAVAYDTITITNATGAVADFVVYASQVGGAACPDPAGPDTFMVLYDTTFDPASPLTGCLAVNDDRNGSSDRCSGLAFSIPVGAVRVVVVTAFDNASLPTGLFNYQVNFTGTTPVELQGFTAE